MLSLLDQMAYDWWANHQYLDAAAKLDHEQFTRIRYTNIKGETWEYNLEQMVHHLAMHSAFHRGQMATMLRQLGTTPPATDYLVFLDAQKSAVASLFQAPQPMFGFSR